MEVYKALQFRIYPSKGQADLINKTLGCSRALYNMMLFERINFYENNKEDRKLIHDHKYKTEKQYKEEFDWMKEVDSIALQQSRIDLVNAYFNFFKSLKGTRKGQKMGFPKFKRRRNDLSYRTFNTTIDYENKQIKIPKVKNIRFRHKKIKPWYYDAKPVSSTVKRTATGDYYISVLFKGEQDFKGYQNLDNPRVIGLDMSMDKFYVDQLGNSPDFKRIFRDNEEKLAKAQKNYSRKAKGSSNKEKARIKIAKIHEDIKNQRKDFVNKLSLKLIRENDVVVIESLSLKGMSQALHLGKSVHDLGYADFINKLTYKALWNDKTVVKANKWFASSKTCSFCGFKKKDLLLQEREWICPNCGTHLDRDQNAGQNLKNYGLDFLGLEQPDFKPVEKQASAIDISSKVSYTSMKQEALRL